MPDALDGVDDLAELPQWCIYVAEADGDGVFGGVWMDLEHDTNTGRPELRVLLDTNPEMGLAGLLAIPLYLDRDNITEAIANYMATAVASIGRTGVDVRGGELDATGAARVDGYLAIARYLARPETDIQSLIGASGAPPVSVVGEGQGDLARRLQRCLTDAKPRRAGGYGRHRRRPARVGGEGGSVTCVEYERTQVRVRPLLRGTRSPSARSPATWRSNPGTAPGCAPPLAQGRSAWSTGILSSAPTLVTNPYTSGCPAALTMTVSSAVPASSLMGIFPNR
ncbi:hypothetical protein FHU28_002336 [Micromonospora echinospora]|uniref:Uncharacterized protein n=1 Tax=Micromonospora echinospora TaxID=1877 RepID=A0ABR6MB76_MICEC|nr:hypothetical protein [Micromonospora echinospora]MBB5112497.1 hypothetical protein [Micromonospora echinospora]